MEKTKNPYKNAVGFALVRGLIFLALGLFFVIRPGDAPQTFLRLIGVVLLCTAGFCLYFYFKGKKEGPAEVGRGRLLLFCGACVGIFGLLVTCFPDVFIAFIMFILGITLLLILLLQLGEISSLLRAGGKGLPWTYYLRTAVILVLAIVLIVDPFGATRTLVFFAGIVFLVAAGMELWNALSLHKKRPAAQPQITTNITIEADE